MSIQDKLASMGLSLPVAAKPLGSYVPAVRSGNLVFTSGQGPIRDGQLGQLGRVGQDLTVEQAQETARRCALNCLAAVSSVTGDLDRIVRIVRVTGYVNSAADFTDQPAVVNGASDFLVELFGEAGKHSRTSVGVYQLPMGIPVEVDLIAEMRD